MGYGFKLNPVLLTHSTIDNNLIINGDASWAVGVQHDSYNSFFYP